MAAIGDVYEARIEGRLGTIQTINVFHWKVTGAGSDIAVLSAPIRVAMFLPSTSIVAKWLPCVHNTFTIVKSTIFNYHDLADFDEQLISGFTGTVTGERLSGFNAWGFRYARGAIGQRYGYKRFAGVAENDVSGESPIAAAVTRLNALAAVMPQIITAGGTTLQAFIAKRPLTLGANPLGQLSTSAAFQRITTQNSRKD